MKNALKWLCVIILWATGLASAGHAAALSSVQTISWGGHTRTYYYYKPTNFDPTKGMIVWLHGGGANAVGLAGGGSDGLLTALADRVGVLVVFPDGKPYNAAADADKHNWNDCAIDKETTANNYNDWDDVGFLKAMIAGMPAKLGVTNLNMGRVYLGGQSDGGLMASRMALQANDVIAAVAVQAGNLPIANDNGAPYKCPGYVNPWASGTKDAVPMILMKGDKDGEIPYGFTTGIDNNSYCQRKDSGTYPTPGCNNGAVHSWYDTLTFWQWKLRIAPNKTTQIAPVSTTNYADTVLSCTDNMANCDGSTVTRFEYGTSVPRRLVFLRGYGAGHGTWGPVAQTLPNRLEVGWKNRDQLNPMHPYFAEEAWAFFTQFTLSN